MASGKKRTLTAADWTGPALEAIARGGLAAVAVETIAKEIGTTKGSFYWHFADRDALIAAALERWEQRDTEGVIATIDPDADVVTQLRALLRLALSAVPGVDTGSVELALQANAAHPLVSATLTRVTRRRVEFMTGLFVELGMSPTQARDRGVLAYAAFLGQAQLAHATPDVMPKGRAFNRYVDQMVEALLTSKATAKR